MHPCALELLGDLSIQGQPNGKDRARRVVSSSVQGRTRADSGWGWQIRTRGRARACVEEPGSMQDNLRTSPGQSFTRARPE